MMLLQNTGYTESPGRNNGNESSNGITYSCQYNLILPGRGFGKVKIPVLQLKMLSKAMEL